jgi:hypothetical protein
VWHYENAVYPKQVRSKHQGAQNVIGYSGAGVTKNFCIACLHSNDGERANSRVHTSNDCEAFTSCTGEFRMLKPIDE